MVLGMYFSCYLPQDLAVHTRVTPNQREVSIRKFIKMVSTNPKVRNDAEILALGVRIYLLHFVFAFIDSISHSLFPISHSLFSFDCVCLSTYFDPILCVSQASKELSSWGLSLHPSVLETEGRRLPPEKILFEKNVITPNLDADWGRDVVREHVISAVSSQTWNHAWFARECTCSYLCMCCAVFSHTLFFNPSLYVRFPSAIGC